MMNEIYLDHAATTSLDPEVLAAMLPYMHRLCGNPSSLHRSGNHAKAAIERARKQIAHLLQVAPAEICFTSGGTEGNNWLLLGSIQAMKIQHVLASPLEHLSVLRPLQIGAQAGKFRLHQAPFDQQGAIQLDQVATWLQNHPRSLVSCMHVNHELGNLADIKAIGALCAEYDAIFHCDTIQSLYCYPQPLAPTGIHLAVGSAHKIHGPQGVGLVYIHPEISITPSMYGGSQEMNRRAGTENVASIVGLAQALAITFRDHATIHAHLLRIKKYMIGLLQHHFPDVVFNGQSGQVMQSSPTLLNVSLPSYPYPEMLVHHLDIHGIAASAGSACTSGSAVGSTVLAALHSAHPHAIRFSFGKYTTEEEIKQTVEALVAICKPS